LPINHQYDIGYLFSSNCVTLYGKSLLNPANHDV
jgi:hypothetical protein